MVVAVECSWCPQARVGHSSCEADLEKSNETPRYRYSKMAAQNACFSCTEVNFMQAEYMIDVLREKDVFRLEFWPA